jgi:hypothetical protein
VSAAGGDTVERAWWQRLDGVPPSLERRRDGILARRGEVTGWRRWCSGSWWAVVPPGLIAIAQVIGLVTDPDPPWGLVAFRVTLLAVCVLSLVANAVVLNELRRRGGRTERVTSP